MDYKDAGKTLNQLCDFYLETGRMTMVSHNILSRPDWDHDACHYHFTLTGRAGSQLYSGEYSKGWGCFNDWLKNPKNRVDIRLYGESLTRDMLVRVVSMQARTIGYEGAQNQIRDAIRKRATLNLSEVISSLLTDASGSDQPYEDWAADLGYDEDSRKGYATWETCNNIRRWLDSIFDRDEMDYLTELSHSL